MARLAPLQVTHELGQRRLGLADEDVVGLGQVLRARRDVRAADDDALTFRLAHPDDALKRLLLHDHRAGEHHVRPLDVGVLQPPDVHVHQTPLPMLRQRVEPRV